MELRSDPAPPTSARDLRSRHRGVRMLLGHLKQTLTRSLDDLQVGVDGLRHVEPPLSQVARRQVEAFATLNRDLLEVARSYLDYLALVHGGDATRFRQVALSAILRELERDLEPVGEAAGVRLEVLPAEPAARVRTDPKRLRPLLHTLAGIVLQATPVGGWFRIAGRRDGDGWTIEMIPSGPGPAPAVLRQCTQPFSELARAEPEETSPEGLRLALCAAMLGRIGGELRLGRADDRAIVEVAFPVAGP